MRITKVSGATFSDISEDEVDQMVAEGLSVKDLKRRLANQSGVSRFCIKLLTEGGELLTDDVPLARWATLQLVLLQLQPADPTLDQQFGRACSQNQLDLVERMLGRPQDPNAKSWHPRDLRRRLPRNVRNPYLTPIARAARKGHMNVVQLLLEAKANLELQSGSPGFTALHSAIWNAAPGCHRIVNVLLDAGANVDASTGSGSTPLHLACEEGRHEVVRALIQAGCKVAARNQAGETALHAAARHGSVQVVQILLNAGVDKDDEATGKGWTALHFAAYWGSLKALQLLIKHGACVDATCSSGFTPLHAAAEQDEVLAARYLLEAGTNQDAKTAYGKTPLDIALEFDSFKVRQLLLQEDGGHTCKRQRRQ